jgi:hypothetical protein
MTKQIDERRVRVWTCVGRLVSNSSTERKAEHRACLGMVRRWHADVIAAIRIVSIALDFLRWNDHPCPVFAPASEQTWPFVFDFGGVAVLLVAATLTRVIWHVPGAVELFVKLHVLRGMMVILSLGRERQAKKSQAKIPHEAHIAKVGHENHHPSARYYHSPTSTAGLAVTENCIHREDAARRGLLLLRHPCRFPLQILASSPVITRSRLPRQDRVKDGNGRLVNSDRIDTLEKPDAPTLAAACEWL